MLVPSFTNGLQALNKSHAKVQTHYVNSACLHVTDSCTYLVTFNFLQGGAHVTYCIRSLESLDALKLGIANSPQSKTNAVVRTYIVYVYVVSLEAKESNYACKLMAVVRFCLSTNDI